MRIDTEDDLLRIDNLLDVLVLAWSWLALPGSLTHPGHGR
jgi:hypothetical protein